MFEKDVNGNFKNKIDPIVPRGIVVRPPVFGGVKVWETVNGEKLIRKKFQEKYWELHYLKTGQLVIDTSVEGGDFEEFAEFAEEFMKCKIEYLRMLKIYYDSKKN